MQQDLGIDIQRTRALLSGITIPPQPEILINLRREQSQSDPDMQKIIGFISEDVALSAEVLRAVNSPVFGLRREVSSLFQAAMLLGLKNIANIVTAAALSLAFGKPDSPQFAGFWESSLRIASVAASLSRKWHIITPDVAYTMGLFLNCGVPLLLKRFTQYAALYSGALRHSGAATTDIEYSVLGTNHTIVGYLICKSWQLPDDFCNVVLYHHHAAIYSLGYVPEGNTSIRIIALIKCAEWLCSHFEGNENSTELRIIMPGIFATLELNPDDVTLLVEEIMNFLKQL